MVAAATITAIAVSTMCCLIRRLIVQHLEKNRNLVQYCESCVNVDSIQMVRCMSVPGVDGELFTFM